MAKILIAEDERDIRDLITFTLRFAGHEVIVTSNGEEAYQKAQEVVKTLPGIVDPHPLAHAKDVGAKSKHQRRFQDHGLLAVHFIQLTLVSLVPGDDHRPGLHVAGAGAAQAGHEDVVQQVIVDILRREGSNRAMGIG